VLTRYGCQSRSRTCGDITRAYVPTDFAETAIAEILEIINAVRPEYYETGWDEPWEGFGVELKAASHAISTS
jgi:hypothetical protein